MRVKPRYYEILPIKFGCCDPCGKIRPLHFCIVSGIDTWACRECSYDAPAYYEHMRLRLLPTEGRRP